MKKITWAVLFTFIISLFSVFMPKVEAASFKVQITASKLAIRSGPSTKYKIVGYYTKGQTVDVIGQSGSFYRTNRGYIHSAYTKKVTTTIQNPISRGASVVFTTFKAQITASKLTIRSGPSTSYKAVGYYTNGQVVDVIGQSGSFYRTNKGYIHSGYTRKVVTQPQQIKVDNTGKYIMINQDTPIYQSINGTADERYAVKGKTYKILEDKGTHFKIRHGALEGYIPVQYATILNYTPKDNITLAWNYIYQKSSNKLYYDSQDDYIMRSSVELGLDVISPTWFDMSGTHTDLNSINVLDKADAEYSRNAHRNGYEVWALFAEFNGDRSYAMFTNKVVMDRVINQIVNYAVQYKVDGINIDFEGLGLKNKEGLVTFTRELTNKLKAKNPLIKVSIDVTKPSTSDTWSRFYDRKALSDIVDYMMFMAYDEHYAGSPVAGSVGSLPWVEQGINEILNLGVPKDKLILGVPFYVRDFKIAADTNTVVSSQALKMQQAYNLISQNAGNIYFDNYAKQDVGEYYDKDGFKHLVWLENAKSMGYRMDLVNKYGLKGMSAWQLYFETSDIWNVIKQKLKQ